MIQKNILRSNLSNHNLYKIELSKKIESFFKELKDSDIGISNHIALVLLTLFFIVVSKKLNLDVGFFSLIYWYVACLLVGHYSAHNIKPTKKFDRFAEHESC